MIESVTSLVKRAEADIRRNYIDMGLRASGKFGEGLEVIEEDNRIRLMAVDHSYYMENGRGSGKAPPKHIIVQWIRDKGIQPSGITEAQLAYLIQRKIGREGIKVPNKYNTGGVISNVITDQLEREIIQTVGDGLKSLIINSLKK